jgi:hypothetical protein
MDSARPLTSLSTWPPSGSGAGDSIAKAPGEEVAKELAKLRGPWAIVSGEQGGEPLAMARLKLGKKCPSLSLRLGRANREALMTLYQSMTEPSSSS